MRNKTFFVVVFRGLKYAPKDLDLTHTKQGEKNESN